MNLLAKLSAVLLIFGLGFVVAKYALPAKTITVEKEVIVEKRNVVTRIIEHKDKDGSSTTETVIDDKTTIDSEKDKKVVVTNERANLNVAALMAYDFKTKTQVYGLHVQKRYAGPIFIGAYGTTQGTVGISVGMEF